MPDPASIRGRWTIWVDRFNQPCDSMRHDAHPVQAVPVPDEAAIERGAKALVEIAARWGLGEWQISGARELAEAVLRAALEPSSDPERTMDRP